MLAPTRTTRSRRSSPCVPHPPLSCGRARALPLTQRTAARQAGRSPLHLAAAGNFTEVVSLLISHGADTNAQNSSQRTALHVAVACDAKDAAVYMLENGARMDIKDEWGSSPLECARNPAMRQLLQPYAVRPPPPHTAGWVLCSSAAEQRML